MPRRRHANGRQPAACIVRHNYYPDTHVRRDAEALAEAGFAVSVIALRRDGQLPRERLNGVEIHRLPVTHRRGSPLRYAWEYSAFALLAFLRVSWLHLRRRFAVVEVDTMPDILVLSALLPKLTGTPVILYVFDNMPELLAYLWKTDARHPVVRGLALLERASCAFADRVIVTQELPRRLAIGRGVPERKISVVLNSADERVFNRERVGAIDHDAGGFRIVTHGALLERYGVQVLIDALPAVLARHPRTTLDVFGEGEHRAALERRAGELGLEAAVRFHGFAPLDELLAALVCADAGYVGMLNDLVLPNKLMEYAALGTPIVISRWDTFRHYFPEDSACYFTPGDTADLTRALLTIAADPTAARERAQRASALYQGYRWTVQREAYLDVYRALVGCRLAGTAAATAAASELPVETISTSGIARG